MVLRGLSFEVLLEDVDDVVGLDALLRLVGELLDRLGVLRLLHLPLDPFLDNVLVSEVNTRGPTTLSMGLDLVIH